MRDPETALDSPTMLAHVEQLGASEPDIPDGLPHFLIISPPKTGSTWLAANLELHPALSLPLEKETRFFSSTWKWCDLRWYVSRFPAEPARMVRGESSPSYALLPVRTIRLLRKLVPDLKLIFLMRDPIARAWSHAKHAWRYKARDFSGCTVALDAVPDDLWNATFVHDWTMASGDYLGQLRRWLSIFPRDQLFVAFYEQIARDPLALMEDVLGFLEVDPREASRMPLDERIYAGAPGDVQPRHADLLRRIHQPAAAALVGELARAFDLSAPSEWDTTLGPAVPAGLEHPAMDRIRSLEEDDRFLARTLAFEEQFDHVRWLVEKIQGYRLYLYRREVFALSEEIFGGTLATLDGEALASLERDGRCFRASTVAELRRIIPTAVPSALDAS